MSWKVEFFEDDAGRLPVRDFLLGLEPAKRAAMIAAVEFILEPRGLDVCGTEYGRQLGGGLFEFRLRHDEGVIRRKTMNVEPGAGDSESSSNVLLRLFCHAYGDKIILLLGGYDKQVDPSPRRQAREIESARKRLRSFRLRREREKAAKNRRS
jgi:hypothetical protein